ncbi:MAG: hypothetical protein ACYSYL_00105 [Planctomycetota bacterium]|jgi:hypothetical protein
MQLAQGMTGEPTGKWRYTAKDVIPTEEGGYRYILERSADIARARLATKTGGTKVQMMPADLSGVTGAAGEPMGLQFMAGMKDIQGAIMERYAALGRGALAEDIAATRGRSLGAVQRWMGDRPYAELGAQPMQAYMAQRAEREIQTVTYPQVMTQENLERFDPAMVRGVQPMEGDMVRASIAQQAIVGEFGKMFSQESPFRRPFLSTEEMGYLRQTNPAEAERLYKAGTPTREAYRDLMRAGLASTGQYAAPEGAVGITPGTAGGLFGAATEAARAAMGTGPEERVSRFAVAQQMMGMLAESSIGGKPMRFEAPGAQPFISPSARTLQHFRARGTQEGTEMSATINALTQLMGRMGEGLDVGEAMGTARSTLMGLAESPQVIRRTMGTELGKSRALGDVLHMSMALRAGEAYIPQLGGAGAGKAAQAMRFPSQMAASYAQEAGVRLLDREEAARRELSPSVAQFSPEMVMAMAGDTDGDKFLAWVRGDAKVDEQGNLLGSEGQQLGNFDAISKSALRAGAEGAANVWQEMASVTGRAMETPGAARTFMERKIQGASVSTPEELRGHFERGAHLRGQIGQIYNLYRGAAGMMPERGQEGFQTLWRAAYGRAQRPAEQLPGLQVLQSVAKGSLISSTGGIMGSAFDPQEKQLRRFVTGGRGYAGAMQEAAYGLRNLRGEGGELLLGSQQFGQLFAGTPEAAPGISKAFERVQQAMAGGGDVRWASGQLYGSVLEQGTGAMAESPIGRMLFPRLSRAAVRKGQEQGISQERIAERLGVSPEFMAGQLQRRELQEARITALSKGRVGLTARAQAMQQAGLADWLPERQEQAAVQPAPLGEEFTPAAVAPPTAPPPPPPVTTAAPMMEPERPSGDLGSARKAAFGQIVRSTMSGMSPEDFARHSQEIRATGKVSPLRRAFNQLMRGVPANLRGEATQVWRSAVEEAGIPTKTDPTTGAMFHSYTQLAGSYQARRAQTQVMGGPSAVPEAEPPPELPQAPPPDIEERLGRGRRSLTDIRAEARSRAQQATMAGTPGPVQSMIGQVTGGQQGQGGYVRWTPGGEIFGRLGEQRMEVTEEHIQRLRTLNKNLQQWDRAISPTIESGEQLSKAQIKLTGMMEKMVKGAEIPRIEAAAEQAGEFSLARDAGDLVARMQGEGMPLGRLGMARGRIEQQAFGQQMQMAMGGGAGGPGRWDPLMARMGGRGPGGFPMGRMGRTAQGMNRLLSGWEMMRLRRMWAMTGAPVFQQMIPAAAQADMAGWQASVAMGGAEPGALPGGAAGGVMQYQAAQRQSLIAAGRRGYQAYGAGVLPGIMQTMQQGQALLGPAAGMGLVGGALATTGAATALGMPMGLAATTVGLPVTLGIGAAAGGLALGQYAMGQAAPTTANQLAAFRRERTSEFGRDPLGQLAQGWQRFGPAMGAILRGDVGIPQLGGGRYREWREEQAQAGARVAYAPMQELGAGDRGAALSHLAGRLREQETWQGLDENQIMQIISQAAPFDQRMEMGISAEGITAMGGTPLMRAIRETGRDPTQYVGLSRQMGMGAQGAADIMTQWQGMSAAEEMQAQTTAGRRGGLGYQIWGTPQDRLVRQLASPLETPERRDIAQGLVQRVTPALGAVPVFGGILGAAGEEAARRVGEQEVQPEDIPEMQMRRLESMAPGLQQAQMMGFQVPEQEITTGFIQQQWEQMPFLQAQMGMQQRLTGLGVGQGAALGATQAVGQYGMQGLRAFGGFLGGDQQIMNAVGQANVMGPFANIGDTGMQMGVGQMRDAIIEGLEHVIPPQYFDSVVEGMSTIKPLLEESGLAMGTTQMYPGFAGDYQLPAGVDQGLFDRFAGVAETGGRRGLRQMQLGITNEYQDFQMRQSQERLDLSAVSQFGGSFTSPYSGETLDTRGTFAIQEELRNLSRIWEDFTSDYQDQQRALNYSQFMENWGVRAERMPTQFQWQREDLAFQGQQQSIQFGWQMEDIQENLRFATGRDRRRLLRQQERAAIQFGMGQGRLETQGERVDVREGWAQEDLERERRHFEERFALQDTYQDQFRRFTDERRRLEDELQGIREFNARFSIDAATENLQRQKEMQAQLRAISEVYNAINQQLQNAGAQQQQLVSTVNWFMGQFNTTGGVRGAWDGFINHVQSTLAAAGSSLAVGQPEGDW